MDEILDGMEAVACPACDRPVVWVHTPKGLPLALDATPDEGGDIRISGEFDVPGGTARRVAIFDDEDAARECGSDGACFRRHRETCLDPVKWERLFD